MQVKWLRKAALNLEDAHDYLVKENPRVAQEFVFEVYRLVNLLVDHLGRAVCVCVGRGSCGNVLPIKDKPRISVHRLGGRTTEDSGPYSYNK